MNQMIPENYKQAMHRMALRVAQSGDEWRKFLTASSYLYKYESYEQLLIYGFKQDVTAVASPQTWKPLGYFPKTGATVIRLPGKRIYYDVSDLELAPGKRGIQLWNTNGVEMAVTKSVMENYDVSDLDSVSSAAAFAIMEEVNKYLDDYGDSMQPYFPPDLDEDYLTLLLLASAQYTAFARLGVTAQFPSSLNAILDGISRYNTVEQITSIVHASWHCSGVVLRQIEKVAVQEQSRRQTRQQSEQRRSRPQRTQPPKEVEGQISMEGIPAAPIVLPPEPTPQKKEPPRERSRRRRQERQTPQSPPPANSEPPKQEDIPAQRYEIRSESGSGAPFGVWDNQAKDFVKQNGLPMLFIYEKHAEVFLQSLSVQVEPPQPEEIIEEVTSVPAVEAQPLSRKAIQDAIDAALQEWNGSNDSKHNVVRYMREHGDEKETANWLRQEYGDDLPRFPVVDAKRDITWAAVQKNLTRLIREERFFTDEEKETLADIDPVEMQESVSRILNATEEELLNDPLTINMEQMVVDAERAFNENLPLTSGISTPETALHGGNRNEIEEAVLNYAEAILDEMGAANEVRIHGVRVYGSRTREGLYHEESDIDVVLSYSGDLREDDFFNRLHEEEWQFGDLVVDINPISTDKSGTLEEYLARAEAYLDEKEAELAAEQQPSIIMSAAVEEALGSTELSNPTVPSAVVDEVLRLGSNQEDSVVNIVGRHILSDPDFLDSIKRDFKSNAPGGRGVVVNNLRYAVWFDERGVSVTLGSRVFEKSPALREAKEVAPFPWEAVAARIAALIDAGQYAPQSVVEQAVSYQVTKCAHALWYMVHDRGDGVENPLPQEWFSGGFPDSTERIAAFLSQPSELADTFQRVSAFAEAYRENREVMRWKQYNPVAVQKRLELLRNSPRSLPVSTVEAPTAEPFITEDEIDDVLRFSGNAQSNLKFYSLIIHGEELSDIADKLKRHYGTGGRSHAVSHADHSNLDYSGKGLRLQKNGKEVHIKWQNAAKRMRDMVLEDRFLIPNALPEMLNYEKNILAQEAFHLLTNTQKLTFYPFEWSTNFYDLTPSIRKCLDSLEKSLEVLECMEKAVRLSDLELSRLKTFTGFITDMRNFIEGRYSLFIPTEEMVTEALLHGTKLYIPDTTPDIEVEAVVESVVDAAEEETQDVVSNSVEDVDIVVKNENTPSEEPIKLNSVVIELFPEREPERVPPVAENFHITDFNLGAGGQKAKYQANVAAIRTLHAVEAEKRNATPEEQEILSRYVGWGGIQEAFDINKPTWKNEFQELQELLPPEDYKAARASVLNAHYTSPTVIHSIYAALEGMGFEQGRILEPAMGVGNFFGMLPNSMRGSELHGVELDSVTGRIAKLLYPQADITVAGFETTNLPPYYDVAVGNVPFGNYQVDDPTYNYLRFSIHNYFAAKMIDQVRPGGITAFVTSRYMMDGKNSSVRAYLAERAVLLGAIRLPNDAFKTNANTSVVTDILFFQRREHPVQEKPDWVYLDTTEDGITLNSYFVTHPEMIMGTLSTESTQYGKEECTVLPKEGVSLADQLREAVGRLPKGIYTAVEYQSQEVVKGAMEEIPADPTIPNYSYCVQDDTLYFKRTDTMLPYDGGDKKAERIKGMVEIRDLTRSLIRCQLDDGSDVQVQAIQALLNSAYDRFVEKYGVLSEKNSANKRLMREDSGWSLIASLEDKDSNGIVTGKADIFTQRTVRHIQQITSCETANEALMVCLNERSDVDVGRIMELTGKDRESVLKELEGRIYRIPDTEVYVTAEEYLSGNVRQKLAQAQQAAQHDPSLAGNVKALEQVQPIDLTADEISVRLGTPWIKPQIIHGFIEDLLNLPFWKSSYLEVIYSDYNSEWRIEGKSKIMGTLVSEKWGTPEMGALKIIERTLNQQDVRITDPVEDGEGRTKYVLNQKATIAVREKQAQIQNAFKDWIFKDPKRREALVSYYNQHFNATRPRSYDGSHLTFDGMNPEIKLMPHQKNAVARALYGGNTLLAHVVGVGKTFEMATIAMESKRIGITHKSMIVVPNHLTEQWGQEFQKLYPGAKLLVTTDQDFAAAKRKQFCTRIATGDWDAVIIGDSQFKMIPMSKGYQKEFYQREVDQLTQIIEQEKSRSGSQGSWSVKALERAKRGVQAKITKMMNTGKKDSVISFEELGIDRLFVDESHLFKNLGIYTKMNNVAGIGTQESSDRANDMYMKCRYMDEITDRKGIVFATGTPISNSMSELYTVCKYLAFDRLQQDGLLSFDAWAAQYGQTVSTMELAPEGTGYRSRTRFSKFVNLPELMAMYHDFADVKLADDLNLNVPEALYETIVAERSPEQGLMMQELSQRATAIRNGVDPSVDNMLKVSNDGRKLGLDQRLIDPTLPDHPYSKVNLCVNKVFEIWEESREERAAQMVFCDSSTPNPDKFNVYDDIKAKLIAAGVPENEIAFIHDAKTKEAKQQLFTKVRNGEVRILFGSTSKMGAGTNAQDRLLALHNLDCPWVPSSLEQRAGRIIRQGNRYKQVRLFNYVTNGSFDSYLWQTVENKQKFIGQVMSGKTPVRSCEDVDEVALSYAEVKALCIGNPLIKVRAELDTDLTRLKMLKSTWQREQYRLSDQVSKTLPASINATKMLIERMKSDAALAESSKDAGYESFSIAGHTYAEQKDAEAALIGLVGDMMFDTPKYVGEWRGFQMAAVRIRDGFEDVTNIAIRGTDAYTVKVTSKANLSKIRKAIDGIPERLQKAKGNLLALIEELQTAKETLEQPWAYEEEFQEKTARLIQVDAELAENADREPPLEQKVIVMPEGQEQSAELPSFDELLKEGQRLAAELNGTAEPKQQTPTL